ncbi:chromatin remodeling complex Adenosinetriphosphatase [Scheffersomyces spartinae]|uniref:Chromatin remodeling complex Adenosinetriphosphatase n=1 Tax=Scheffersomyces spartinae TaxID=45513 RepID=A0A9P8AJY0_9ASCO|nr:chromatin remodeling complex Adenosinetriphosphatase [Scheffersomyces spartinae]KAG7194567.1 chromatin remodeling complex Adenosinetriphosphatase [Scheffersomyces spartinae]
MSETREERIKRFFLDTDPKTAKKNDIDDSTKRFKYLLGLTDLFRHFIDINASKDARFKKMIKQIDSQVSFQGKSTSSTGRKGRGGGLGRRRKTEKEEDAELLLDEEHIDDEETQQTVLTESPSYIKDGKLREYQIQGLNWLISLHDNRLSGILADEMGLGKTLQTISFLGFLRYIKKIDGPFIVIVPKSTLDNWRREFAKWTPDVNTLVLQGNKEQRTELFNNRFYTADFDVLITSFEMVIREKSHLKKIRWEYIIVDEAHRIKNEDSSLSQIIRLFFSRNRLLITGTPLQNNLHELWALLNFLLPDVFGDSEMFDEWFESQSGGPADQDDDNEDSDVRKQDKVVQQLHQVLSPFLLRRVKADVERSLLPKVEVNIYTGMTDMQIDWYKKLLEKDIDAVNGVVGKREGKTRLLNIVMQLRKCCNHPYLFDGAEPGPPYTTDEHLVYNSGKMIILDKMLRKFKKEGSRVLIFSQMSRLLDILEDYCYLRDYEYCRIDGSTDHEDRIEAIDSYNAPDSDKFIFLLTTRAGGLGINLTSADIVILYDSDWNPQADLQAMDRAHRIGQKKQVKVYRFVTENAIEEKVLERAAQKLRLDQLVIQQGRQLNTGSNAIGNTKDDLLGMIQHGAKEVFESKNATSLLDDDIESILKRGAEKTSDLNNRYNKLGLDDLQNITFDSSTYEWNGQNFAKKDNSAAGGLGFTWINPSKRERKEQTYSVDNYYKDVMKNVQEKGATKQERPKAPKAYNVQDHQFFPDELVDLLEREQYAHKKEVGYKYSVYDFGGDSDDDKVSDLEELSRAEQRDLEQQKVKDAIPLTEEEQQRKDHLLTQCFHSWTRRDFTNYIHGAAKYGRTNYKDIAEAMANKDQDEVERYLKAFWQQYKEIEGYDKYISQIEASEKKAAKLINQQKLLNIKMENLENPLEDLKIQYPPNNAKRVYSKLEDGFILNCVHKLGLFTDNLGEKIKEEILASDLFRFDWYICSRTPQELSRRVNTLLLAITREMEGPLHGKRRKGDTSNSSTRAGTVDPIENGKK